MLKLRLKDKHSKFLILLAREVNFVWNYCNELQVAMFNRERRLFSGYDFAKFTRGATCEGLHLHSQSVQAIAEEYATRRQRFPPKSVLRVGAQWPTRYRRHWNKSMDLQRMRHGSRP